MTVENNVGSVLKYSDGLVGLAMASIGYTPYHVSPEDLQKLTAIVEQLNDWQCKAVTAVNGNIGFVNALEEANILLQADEIPFHEFDDSWFMSDDKKLGYYVFDNGLGPDDVQALYDGPHGCYVDVEAYGRDVRLEGAVTITAYGFLFRNGDMPDTDYYSEAEIDEWIKENA